MLDIVKHWVNRYFSQEEVVLLTILMLVGWVVLMRFILPRLGVST